MFLTNPKRAVTAGPPSPGRRSHLPALATAVAVLAVAAPAFAATSGGDPMPWEGPLAQILAFFTGPFVRVAAILAIILLGIGMAFSENGSGTRKLTSAFFGLSLAFGAATWGLSFFGFSGGASITPDAAEVAGGADRGRNAAQDDSTADAPQDVRPTTDPAAAAAK